MDWYETYEFGDRFDSAAPLETALSLVPSYTLPSLSLWDQHCQCCVGKSDTGADAMFGVDEAGGRSAGAEGADGASVGYDLGLASRTTEVGASGAAEADATAVVMLIE